MLVFNKTKHDIMVITSESIKAHIMELLFMRVQNNQPFLQYDHLILKDDLNKIQS
jgi:hypothetical protein